MLEHRNSVHNTRFFFIYSGNREVDLSEDCKGNWKGIETGDFWLFCSDDFSRLPAAVGNRHENGDGVFLRIDKSGRTISFETDEISGVPVFWTQKEDFLIITSDLSLLIDVANSLDISLEVNLKAASEILIAGYVFSDQQTLIGDVKILAPRSTMTIDLKNGELTIESHREEFRYYPNTLSVQESLKKFQHSLIQGLRRHQGKNVAVLLSGGADSRTIALLAENAGLDPDFLTFGQSTVNASDFPIANQVAYRFEKKTRCFKASAEHFKKHWKKRVAASNWINDSFWWSGMLPDEFFETLQDYDIVLRGDGDGCYGWKETVVNINDALHRIEITPPEKALEFSRYFKNPNQALSPGIESQSQLIEKYKYVGNSTRELQNILYKEIREWRCIAPGVWNFSRMISIDSPFLWQEPLNIAKKLPKEKRSNKWIIFEMLKQDHRLKDIPLSSGGSWNLRLEFYYSGVWEELLDYVKHWSPWDLNIEALREEFLKPPDVLEPPSISDNIRKTLKNVLLNRKYVRLLGLKYFPNLAGTSMSDRILLRIALVSSLQEKLENSTQSKKFLKFKKHKE